MTEDRSSAIPAVDLPPRIGGECVAYLSFSSERPRMAASLRGEGELPTQSGN